MCIYEYIVVYRPDNCVVADFGCGDAKVARTVNNKVHSFDLAAANEHVTVCDMANVSYDKHASNICTFLLY